jgi:hypothetical protein
MLVTPYLLGLSNIRSNFAPPKEDNITSWLDKCMRIMALSRKVSVNLTLTQGSPASVNSSTYLGSNLNEPGIVKEPPRG